LNDPCCPPGLCDFTPERVRFWLQEIRVARLSNLDPVLIARDYASPRGERHMGRGACNSYGNSAELVVIAILEYLPKGYTAGDVQILGRDVEKLACKLCPHATPRCAIIGSQRDDRA
jgi:hypothetical protein